MSVKVQQLNLQIGFFFTFFIDKTMFIEEKRKLKQYLLTETLFLILAIILLGSTLDNKKGIINQNFLQKLNCMKTVWEQARFSILV